jgi:hypothetical protein
MIISRWILLRLRNFSDRSCRENQNTLFCSVAFCRKSYRLWDNMEKYGRARQATDDNMIRRMSFACSIIKATDIHSEYVIFIPFPRQQWSRERASMLRLYVNCLSCSSTSRNLAVTLLRNFKIPFLLLLFIFLSAAMHVQRLSTQAPPARYMSCLSHLV